MARWGCAVTDRGANDSRPSESRAEKAGRYWTETAVHPRRLRLLLLCDYRVDGAQTVIDHIEAIRTETGHDVTTLAMYGDLPDRLELARFDGIIIHYSLTIASDLHISLPARDAIRRFAGLKAVFIQDEYRWVNNTCDALEHLGAHVLFTCVPVPEIEKVYPASRFPGLEKINVLTGYVPASLLNRPFQSYAERPIDVGYRARRLSAFHGELAMEKWKIAERFLSDAKRLDVRCDISCEEHERLYGEEWIRFVSSCKAMLGAESGAGVFDFTGEIQQRVMEYERKNPRASFEEIRDAHFPGLDGVIKLNQISPRCFEAAALRTLMILYEGEYSGVLVPGRHYLALRKDHSNVEEVVETLKNEAQWVRITSAAYEEVACAEEWSYAAFGRKVGRVLVEAAARMGCINRQDAPYSEREFDAITSEHRERLGRINKERAAFSSRRWHLITRLAQRGPSILVEPARAAWHLYRRLAGKS